MFLSCLSPLKLIFSVKTDFLHWAGLLPADPKGEATTLLSGDHLMASTPSVHVDFDASTTEGGGYSNEDMP